MTRRRFFSSHPATARQLCHDLRLIIASHTESRAKRTGVGNSMSEANAGVGSVGQQKPANTVKNLKITAKPDGKFEPAGGYVPELFASSYELPRPCFFASCCVTPKCRGDVAKNAITPNCYLHSPLTARHSQDNRYNPPS